MYQIETLSLEKSSLIHFCRRWQKICEKFISTQVYQLWVENSFSERVKLDLDHPVDYVERDRIVFDQVVMLLGELGELSSNFYSKLSVYNKAQKDIFNK